MTDDQARQILQNSNAILLDGHFALTPKEVPPGSKQFRYFHSDTYVLKDRVFEDALALHALAGEIADRYLKEVNDQPGDFVLGLEKGAIALASHVAFHLQMRGHIHIRAGYAEANKEGGFFVGRGFARDYSGKKVLIVEDIVVSGTSLRGALQAVRDNAGILHWAFAICLRGNADTGDVPFSYLYKLEGTNIWPEEECPRCKDPAWGPQSIRLDVNKHGKEFFDRRGIPIPDSQPNR